MVAFKEGHGVAVGLKKWLLGIFTLYSRSVYLITSSFSFLIASSRVRTKKTC